MLSIEQNTCQTHKSLNKRDIHKIAFGLTHISTFFAQLVAHVFAQDCTHDGTLFTQIHHAKTLKSSSKEKTSGFVKPALGKGVLQ